MRLYRYDMLGLVITLLKLCHLSLYVINQGYTRQQKFKMCLGQL